MIDANIPNIENVQRAWSVMQEQHIVYPEILTQQLAQARFNDIVDKAISPEALDAALQEGTFGEKGVICHVLDDDYIPAEHEQPSAEIVIFPAPKLNSPSSFDKYFARPGDDFKPSSRAERFGQSPITIERYVEPVMNEVTDVVAVVDNLDTGEVVDTHMGIGEPRVIDYNPDVVVDHGDYQKVVSAEPERPAFGGMIPGVKWGEMESILVYLGIFKDVVTKERTFKAGRFDYTEKQIEANIEAEYNSKVFKIMSHKLKNKLVVDRELNVDIAKQLNDAGYPVSYMATTGRLVVEITPDNKLSWVV